ncbi:hypothetical protein OAA78_04765 [Flavobacteriaceae bacterium]|nr:hypothetical protein [Flavobacteriaceae bacterium]
MKNLLLLIQTLIVLLFISCNSEKKYPPEKNEKETYYRTEGLREQFVGKNLSDIRNDYELGSSQTLNGTTNKYWLVYFNDINITMKVLKSSDEIINICSEKNESLLNDKSIEFKKFVGKKYTNDEYLKIVSSIKYGKVERLGEENCLNKNCVEYYPNGNFTTMSFYEFNDDGNFVKFNRVGFGKLTNISNYDKKDLKEYYLNKIEVLTKSEYSDKVQNDIEFKKLRDGSTVVGKWYVKIKGLSKYNYQYEIYKKNNKFYGVMISELPIIKTLTKKGNKYYEDNNEFGEYYTTKGSLKFYDKDGILTDYEGTSIK